MKNLYFTLILVFTILAIASCKKNNSPQPTDFSGSYVSSTTASVGKLEMHTKAGVTTDVEAIRSFAEQYKQVAPLADFFHTENTLQVDANIFKLQINTDGSVQASLIPGSGSSSEKLSGSIIQQNDQEIVLAGDKTQKQGTSFYTRYMSLGFTIPTMIYKPFPLMEISRSTTLPTDQPITTPPSNSNGIYDPGYGIIIAPQLRLVVKNGELYLPVLYYQKYSVVKNTDGTIRSIGILSALYRNIINPNLSDAMNANETIIIQQRLIKLTKQ